MDSLTQQTGVETLDPPVVGPASAHRESLASYFGFAAGVLGIDSHLEDGVLELAYKPQDHPDWPKPHRVHVTVSADAIEHSQRRQLNPVAGTAWLWERAVLAGPALSARPAARPEAVHEFSSRLFRAYQVDGGQVHLAGCHLIDVPFVRLTFLLGDDCAEVEHLFFTAEGEPVAEELLEELGLADVRPLGAHPPVCDQTKAETLVNKAKDAVANLDGRFIAATLIGAKWAEGSLQFEVADQSAHLEFSGWTATLSPPPFHCDASGVDTYHVAAIDDGRVVAAEAIDVCEESDNRVLACEMVTCKVTGKRVDGTLTEICPITGDPALAREFVACTACGQQASRKALTRGVCKACRSLRRVAADDPIVAPLLARYPGLAKFHQWRAAESCGVSRLEAIGGWQRMLLAFREDKEPLAVATSNRLLSRWRQLPETEWPSVLG
ncbi:MAG: hypothetical protein ACR2NU_13945 [Aeoliella sp.]